MLTVISGLLLSCGNDFVYTTFILGLISIHHETAKNTIYIIPNKDLSTCNLIHTDFVNVMFKHALGAETLHLFKYKAPSASALDAGSITPK